ncbi:DNA ligase [Pseudomonas phage PPpW-4]|uniref:Putative DNA ligase n=1 Tax=Pseudomonas phage PPpW-4 TaxID=1279083 RepID=V5YTS9_9CAUD|nr:DNA ligase [Pseudomonas phage PPpW-4]BAO20679.1 putative DNA ligase [Pseudomonas phage PPpW-4]
MAVAQVILKTNPHRPVDFKESSVEKVIDSSGNVNVEVKADGCQLNMVVMPAPQDPLAWTVSFLSREGKAFNGLDGLGAALSCDARWAKFFNPHLDAGLFRENGGFLLQAEILTLDETGKPKVCAEIAGDLRRMEPIPLDRIKIIGFDLIPLDAVLAGGDYEVFQEVRRGHLEVQIEALKSRFPEINWGIISTVPAFSLAGLANVYEDFRKRGYEGGVAKDPLGYWKRGKKTGQWKVKPDDECDGVVTGLMWGTPGLSNDGLVIGFTVLTEHGVEVEAGGITDAQKDEFTTAVRIASEMAYGAEQFPLGPQGGISDDLQGDTVNPYEGHAVKITYMERLPSGSYRHPSFDSFRGITDPRIKE